jgi:hypothetical protein
MIDVRLWVEGPLDEAVLRYLLKTIEGYNILGCNQMGGRSKIQKKAADLNAAKELTSVVLVDLDKDSCPPTLIGQWLPDGRSPNFLLRVTVRAVEAWLLADRNNAADFLGIPLKDMPKHPESLDDPCQTLVNLARKSKKRHIREDIVPDPKNKSAQMGKGYNERLSEYVYKAWSIEAALEHAPSLNRTYRVLQNFKSDNA